MCLAQQLGNTQGLIQPMLALFTLGTIADLAPLTGVNRRWVKRGLKLLPKSQVPGIQALIQVAGVQARGAESSPNPQSPVPNPQSPIPNAKTLKPEDIGFRLGPRINAIGRIGDPQTVIELLTTDDMGVALARAIECEQANIHRQQMCEQIEQEAVTLVETQFINSLSEDRVLVIIQPNWHHGVIGIVASRLVERYGVPVFIGTYENDTQIRGSARGIPEFHVFEALEYCHDLLGKFGGHKAAGGFSLPAANLQALRSRLSEFANQCLEPQHLKPLLQIDAEANFHQLHRELYQQLDSLHPCGIDNPDPVFWTPNVKVVEQRIVGKGHIKLTLSQNIQGQEYKIKAIAWRWRDYYPLPSPLDIAYKLRENHFNGNTTLEMELVGVRLPKDNSIQSSPSRNTPYLQLFYQPSTKLRTSFEYNQHHYTCGIYQHGSHPELRIKNSEGKVLVMQPGSKIGLLGTNRQDAKEIDLSLPQYDCIIQAALTALSSVSPES